MSEYHDTNEDERDWTAWKRERFDVGRSIRNDASTDNLFRILARVVLGTGDQWVQAGYHGLPFNPGGYDSLPLPQ